MQPPPGLTPESGAASLSERPQQHSMDADATCSDRAFEVVLQHWMWGIRGSWHFALTKEIV